MKALFSAGHACRVQHPNQIPHDWNVGVSTVLPMLAEILPQPCDIAAAFKGHLQLPPPDPDGYYGGCSPDVWEAAFAAASAGHQNVLEALSREGCLFGDIVAAAAAAQV